MISGEFDFSKEKFYYCEECGYRWIIYSSEENTDEEGNILMDIDNEEKEIHCPQCGNKIN